MKREILPGVDIEMVATGSNLLTVRVSLKKGSAVPEHSHLHEQTSFIYRGCLKYVIDGREATLREGEGIIIRPNVPHSCTAPEDTVDINTFFPVRDDYLTILSAKGDEQ